MSRLRRQLARVLRRPERDERGATAVFVAIVMGVVLLMITAFTIDLGMQRSGRRDMQAVADLVALDMGRLIDGRTKAEIETGNAKKPSAATQLGWSMANNDNDVIGSSLSVTAYWVELNTDGSYAEAGGVPVEVSSGGVPTGVVVRAMADVGFAFAGVTGIASGDVERTAVALADESACFRLGSYAARLDSSSSALLNSVLGGILGGGVNLDVLSYTGIANANVSLLDIALEMGFGSVDELLAANVTAGSLLIAAADVLQADGTSHANILNMVGVALGGLSINVADLISAEPGTGAAETATINAFDLLAGTVLIANGTNAIAIPALTATLPLTGTNLTTSLSIIEKPRQRCGKRGGTADTAQVALAINGDIANATVLGLTATGTAAVNVNVASARGVLNDIICGSETAADPSGEDVAVTHGLVTASAAVSLGVNGTVLGSGSLGPLLNGLTSLLTLVASIEIHGNVTITAGTSEHATPKTAQIRVPNDPATWDDPISLGSGDLGLNTVAPTVTWNSGPTITAKNILGLNVNLNVNQQATIITNLVSSLVTSRLNPLLTAVNSNLLQPLMAVLGLSIGGADVFGHPPFCSEPSLVG